MNSLYYLILALAAGMMIPFQSAMNSELGKSLQSPYYAALTVFIVAAVGVTFFVLVTQQPIPALQRFTSVPRWSYLGGVLGGLYILLIVLCAPKLGIGNVTVLVLLGQILSAIIIDHFGLLNAQIHTVNWQRIVGLILMVSGVFLVKRF